MKILYIVALIAVMAYSAPGAFAGELSPLDWKYKGTLFSGLYAGGEKDKPGIVIFHQWMGISAHEKEVAAELNGMGYTVLVADLYGRGNTPADRDGAKKIAGSFYADRQKLRDHATEAVKALMKKSGKSGSEIYAIGYCFGGSAVLELARTGIELRGFVSLHGGLANPSLEDDLKINGRVLILHGAEDQAVPMSDVTLLIGNLGKYKKDFSVHIFADAVHGFTHRNDPERYNKKADKRSWKIMTDFFDE